MREIWKRINQFSASEILLFVLCICLPFQERYHHILKKLSRLAFQGQELPSYFLERSFAFFLSDFLLIALLFTGIKLRKKGGGFLVAFLLISFVSILFSQSSGQFWAYGRWLQLALIAFIAFVKFPKKRIIRICFWILFSTSLIQSVITIDQYFTQNTLGLKRLGEPKLTSYSPIITVRSQQRWIFDKWLGKMAPNSRILRPSGTFPHPNILGAFLVLGITATASLFAQTKKRWLAFCIPLQIFALALTYSRGAIFGLGISSLILFIFAKNKRITIALPILVGLAFLACTLKDQYVDRGGVLVSSPTSTTSDSMRAHYHKMALNMFRDHPWLGVGYGQYLLHAGQYDPQTTPYPIQKVHNVYLLILAESGIFALLALLAFQLSVLYSTFRAAKTIEGAALLGMQCFILFGFMVDYFWIEVQHGMLMLFVTDVLALQARQIQSDSTLEELQSPTESYLPS